MIGKAKSTQGAVVFVGNLKFSAAEGDLMDLFTGMGFDPQRARLLYDGEGNSRGTGFVEMRSPEDASDAVSKLQGHQFQGRTLKVSLAADGKR